MADVPMREGGCHCGKVRYQVATDLAKLVSCNCSICSKHGLILTFVPEAQFKLLSGAGELQEYLFNKHVIHHQFCRSCGVEPFARGTAPGAKSPWSPSTCAASTASTSPPSSPRPSTAGACRPSRSHVRQGQRSG